MIKPFKHQEEAFEFIKDKDHFALFMEQGTGKSKVTIMKTDYLHSQGLIDRLLVICPDAVKEQWVEEQFNQHCETANWSGIFWDGFGSETKKDAFIKLLKFNGLKVMTVNVEAFQYDKVAQYVKMFIKEGSVMVVIDESTRIKNGRRKPVRGGKRAGAKRTNAVLDLFEKVQYKGILTGTPLTRNPFDLWSQFEFLKKDFFGMDFFFFQHRYGILMKNRTAGGKQYFSELDEKTFARIKKKLNEQKVTSQVVEEISIKSGLSTKDVLQIHQLTEFARYKNLEELKDKISEVTFFIRKEQCMDLPPKIFEVLRTDLSPTQRKLYENLKKQMFAEYEGKELTVLNKLVLYLRLQMVTGGLFPYPETYILSNTEDDDLIETKFSYSFIGDNSKLKVLMEDIEDLPEDVSCIIWARFTGEIEAIYQSLINAGYTAEKYIGGSKISVVNRFKEKEFQFLVANPQKGGEGLNLQISTLQYFFSNSSKADSRLQAEDRSHRIGQTNKVTYKDIVARDTIDDRILAVLKDRKNLIDYFRTKDLKDIL
jgi:SNF2 family DNA or RNA helicase